MDTFVKKERSRIVRSFAVYNLGIFFCWGAFIAVFDLQSSINVEDGLGTTTVAASYLVSVVFSLIGTPVMIRKFGAKVCLVIGDSAFCLYVLANLYPRYYTLLPAGIIMTILQASMWPSMSILNVLYANEYSALCKTSDDVHVIKFSGYFFTSFQMSQVFGSLISYVILYGVEQISIQGVGLPSNCTEVANASCHSSVLNYTSCGANDCQNADTISESISQYKPTNPVSLYLLVGVTLLLELTATLIHLFTVPSDASFTEKTEEYKSLMAREEDKNLMETVSPEPDHYSGDGGETSGLVTSPHDTKSSEDGGMLKLVINTTKAVCRHCIDVKLLLLVPMTLYNGFAMAYAFTELTRAYASCVLGVQWVGICTAVFGLADALLSWVVGKFGRRVGRVQMFLIALVIECGNYVYCLLWRPGPHLLLSIIGVFFTFGVTDGIIQTMINVTHIDFFSEKRDVAITVWNVLVVLGMSLGYALSTAFCVNVRIYFNSGLLLVAFVCIGIAEIYHRKQESEKKHSKEEKMSIPDGDEQDARQQSTV